MISFIIFLKSSMGSELDTFWLLDCCPSAFVPSGLSVLMTFIGSVLATLPMICSLTQVNRAGPPGTRFHPDGEFLDRHRPIHPVFHFGAGIIQARHNSALTTVLRHCSEAPPFALAGSTDAGPQERCAPGPSGPCPHPAARTTTWG